jgi:hypothetical protein
MDLPVTNETMAPYTKLIESLLLQAVRDLRTKNRRARGEALSWIGSDDGQEMIEFLGYNPEEVLRICQGITHRSC